MSNNNFEVLNESEVRGKIIIRTKYYWNNNQCFISGLQGNTWGFGQFHCLNP